MKSFLSHSFSLLIIVTISLTANSVSGQSIIHFQNWEGSSGDGGWLAETGGTNQWIRGTDESGKAPGAKSAFISSNSSTYGYNITTAEETYFYKDINFPSDATYDIQVTFDWKCIGEETGGIAYDYMKVYVVDRSLAVPTESNIDAYGGFVFALNGGNEFHSQATFTNFNETLPTSVEGRSDLRIVFTWTNDNNTTNGDPAAIDNIIISLGPPPSSLSGQYLVGQASGTFFPTITDAVYFLNAFGVSGNVTFALTDASYDNSTEYFPIIINNFNGNPPSPVANSNTLTIKPNTAVTSTIIGSVNGATTVDGIKRGLMTLNEADNVIIDGSNNGTTSRNLTINNTNTTEANSIFIASDNPNFNDNITVKNSIIETAYDNTGNTSIGILIMDDTYTTGAGGFSNIILDNNQFKKGIYGIYLDGGSAGAINGSFSSISDNDLEQSTTDAINQIGIYVRGVSSGTISGNSIGNFNNSEDELDYGIYLASGATNVTVEKNDIHDLSYSGTNGYAGIGIRVASATSGAGNILKNNVIYAVDGDGWDITHATNYIFNPFGILLTGTQSGIDIYNNSIYLSGNTLNQSNALSVGIGLGTGSTADIRNNIIVNNLGLTVATGIGSAGIFAQNGNSQFENINYNNYYSNATGLGTDILGRIATTNYTTLSSWKTASASDASSITADPGYTSVSNLLPDATSSNSWYANGTGVQIVMVNDDINGNARSTTVANGAPDMGAYEFTPSSTPVNAAISGTHLNTFTETFKVGDRTIAEITWGAAGTLPSINFLRYYSGANPPNPTGGAQFFNSYVDIDVTGGSGYTYDLKLYYDEALLGTLSAEADARLSKDDGTGWISFSSQTPDQANNNITVTGLSSFSVFSGSDIDNLLPVELLYFRPEILNNQIVKLTWATASEINNDYFEVLKSKNGFDWEILGTVDGNGTSDRLIIYSVLDEKPFNGNNYYRLKQVDYDGQFELFEIKIISFDNHSQFEPIILYPNPCVDDLNISFISGGSDLVLLSIYNHAGRVIMAERVSTVDGSNQRTLNTSALQNGMYILEIKANNQTRRLKFIKN